MFARSPSSPYLALPDCSVPDRRVAWPLSAEWSPKRSEAFGSREQDTLRSNRDKRSRI